jgi:hypothetical protein
MLAERQRRRRGGWYNTPQLLALKVRRETARTIKEEIELAALVDRYVDLEEAKVDWAERVLEIKQAFVGLGAELVPRMQGLSLTEQQHIIDMRVYKLLVMLAQKALQQKDGGPE